MSAQCEICEHTVEDQDPVWCQQCVDRLTEDSRDALQSSVDSENALREALAAARAEALEEAARICEAHAPGAKEYRTKAEAATRFCADEIRALAAKETK